MSGRAEKFSVSHWRRSRGWLPLFFVVCSLTVVIFHDNEYQPRIAEKKCSFQTNTSVLAAGVRNTLAATLPHARTSGKDGRAPAWPWSIRRTHQTQPNAAPGKAVTSQGEHRAHWHELLRSYVICLNVKMSHSCSKIHCINCQSARAVMRSSLRKHRAIVPLMGDSIATCLSYLIRSTPVIFSRSTFYSWCWTPLQWIKGRNSTVTIRHILALLSGKLKMPTGS